MAVKVIVQLWVDVAVFQHLVPFRGVVLIPDAPSTTAPAPDVCKTIVALLLPDPTENVLGVFVTEGMVGEVVSAPVRVPVAIMLASGHGTVLEVQASTVTFSGQSVPVPLC